MAAEKLDLIAEERLMSRPVVDIEVIDARISPQLTQRSPSRRRYRRPRLGDLI